MLGNLPAGATSAELCFEHRAEVREDLILTVRLPSQWEGSVRLSILLRVPSCPGGAVRPGVLYYDHHIQQIRPADRSACI